MAENWKPYICNVNDKVASIFVDLGLREVVPIASKPWLLWTWVHFQSPRADGLSDGKEAPKLWKVEDCLNLCVARACQAIPCGRITTEGRREFYFYGETKDGFRKAVQEALTGFDGYKYDIGEQHDALWEQYLDVLYPSAEDLQRMANVDVLDVLVQQGDVLTIAREVQHWMYFPSAAARASFRNAVTEVGFKIVAEPGADGALAYGIVVARTQKLEQKVIDETVVDLLRLASRFDGEYDGWETPVVAQ